MTTFRRIRPALAAVLSFVVAYATLAPQPLAATRSFLWRASKGQGVVYLVGSVHMLTADFYPLAPALDAAFKDSDLLVEEADLSEMLSPSTQFSLLQRGMLPAGQTLDKVVSPATIALVNAHAGALGAGGAVEAVKQFKPWFLAMTLEAMEWQKAGFDPQLGLDKHFYDRAQSEGKTVQGLETTEYQISLFDGMTAEQQERFLAETLKDLNKETASVNQLASAWKSGDVAGVERFVLQDLQSDPQVYQRLLVGRNRNWLPKIEALFSRPRPSIVVVGAAHLVGPDGLVSMLKAKGYTLTQL
jgi:uncharacterized protein YbaP (TraB family)